MMKNKLFVLVSSLMLLSLSEVHATTLKTIFKVKSKYINILHEEHTLPTVQASAIYNLSNPTDCSFIVGKRGVLSLWNSPSVHECIYVPALNLILVNKDAIEDLNLRPTNYTFWDFTLYHYDFITDLYKNATPKSSHDGIVLRQTKSWLDKILSSFGYSNQNRLGLTAISTVENTTIKTTLPYANQVSSTLLLTVKKTVTVE